MKLSLSLATAENAAGAHQQKAHSESGNKAIPCQVNQASCTQSPATQSSTECTAALVTPQPSRAETLQAGLKQQPHQSYLAVLCPRPGSVSTRARALPQTGPEIWPDRRRLSDNHNTGSS